jgi:ribosomal protein S18 acetylase RimI-like enzyme
MTALTEAPGAFGSTLSEWSGAGDTEQRWRARFEEVALNLVLTCDGEAVGLVSTTAPDGAQPAELISQWVTPTGRGRGVGDEAVRQVLVWVHENFPGSGVILSVKSNNHLAIGLYGRHGFVDVGPSPYEVDERLMRLSGLVDRVRDRRLL